MAAAVRVATAGLLANRLRSVLTTLGIVVGVGSVIVMVALAEGSAAANLAAIRKLGTNVLTVYPSSQSRGGISMGLGSQQTLRPADVAVIAATCPSVSAVSAEYSRTCTVRFRNQNTRTSVVGAPPIYFNIRNLPIAEGRCFTDEEDRRRAKVAVLGDSVRETLFGSEQATGKYVKINGQNFLVTGVVAKRGAAGRYNPDDQVTIPIVTAMRRLFGVPYLGALSVQAASEGKMEAAREELFRAFGRAHRLRTDQPSDVWIRSQADVSESAAEQAGFLMALLTGVASVSLLVGGIGIMNIMLVSVTERTREIGIRKAVGSRRRDILYQFLIESVTLSLVGGALGVAAGIGVSVWMGRPAAEGGLGLPMLLSVPPMVVAFGFSALVGIFFGIYPAVKASQLQPVDALRHE